MKTFKESLQPKAVMTASQRRKAVAVARDVIAQLRLKRITASTGDYLIIDGVAYDNPNQSFQETFRRNKGIKCEVCAIGAAYIGYINKFNNVTHDEVLNAGSETMIHTLSGIFQEYQLRLMEAAFEGRWILESNWYKDERVNRSILLFYKKYKHQSQRLRAIMLNVIRNNGEFRLPTRAR